MENEKNKKTFFKKWWFWAIVVVIVIVASDSDNNSNITSTSDNFANEEKPQNSTSYIETEEKKKQEEEERQENIENTKWSLYATTEQLIKNRLKAPSTAKFSDPIAVYDENTKIYKVQGTVDAQNSFGAMIRSVFYAEYNNQLEIIYLVFDNEVLLDAR